MIQGRANLHSTYSSHQSIVQGERLHDRGVLLRPLLKLFKRHWVSICDAHSEFLSRSIRRKILSTRFSGVSSSSAPSGKTSFSLSPSSSAFLLTEFLSCVAWENSRASLISSGPSPPKAKRASLLDGAMGSCPVMLVASGIPPPSAPDISTAFSSSDRPYWWSTGASSGASSLYHSRLCQLDPQYTYSDSSAEAYASEADSYCLRANKRAASSSSALTASATRAIVVTRLLGRATRRQRTSTRTCANMDTLYHKCLGNKRVSKKHTYHYTNSRYFLKTLTIFSNNVFLIRGVSF